MPVNGFSVGRDVTLTLITEQGAKAFSLITGFDSKPDTTEQKVKGLDGVTRHLVFPNGWSGGFTLERQDNTLDDYWATLEDNYYAGTAIGSGTITETITEVSGAITQYRYEGVTLKLDSAGSWQGDKTVTQKLNFLASRRKKVA